MHKNEFSDMHLKMLKYGNTDNYLDGAHLDNYYTLVKRRLAICLSCNWFRYNSVRCVFIIT